MGDLIHTDTKRTSWSLILGSVEQLLVSIGLFVKKRSRTFLSRVGKFTSCVKKQSADIFNKDWLITNGYLCLDTDSVSQSISGRLKSPVQQIKEFGFPTAISVMALNKFCA